MSIRIREVDNINILDVEGNIDINSSDIVETVGWLLNTGKLNLILNMENVDLVDYSGLSALALAYKNVTNHNGKLKFLHVPLPVIELFKIVRLDTVFDTYMDEKQAINSFYEEGLDKIKLRRKFKRLDIHLRVKYKMVSEQKKPKVFEGDVLNIGAAGLYIYSPYTFPLNTMLELEFSIPGTPSILEASGRVAWLADKELQPHSSPGMGVAFVHLTPEKEKLVVDFIDKNITNRSEST